MLQLDLLVVLPAIYCVVGGLVFGLWLRHNRRQARFSFRATPVEWLSCWLRPLIAFEIYVWSGAALTCLLILTLTPILRTEEAPPALLAFGTVLGVYAIMLVAFDVALVARIRGLCRQARARRADENT